MQEPMTKRELLAAKMMQAQIEATTTAFGWSPKDPGNLVRFNKMAETSFEMADAFLAKSSGENKCKK